MLPSGLAEIRWKAPGSLNDCRVTWWPGIQKLTSKRSKLQCDLGFVCLFTCLFLFLEVGMELSFVTAAYLFNLNNTNHLRLYHPEHAWSCLNNTNDPRGGSSIPTCCKLGMGVLRSSPPQASWKLAKAYLARDHRLDSHDQPSPFTPIHMVIFVCALTWTLPRVHLLLFTIFHLLLLCSPLSWFSDLWVHCKVWVSGSRGLIWAPCSRLAVRTFQHCATKLMVIRIFPSTPVSLKTGESLLSFKVVLGGCWRISFLPGFSAQVFCSKAGCLEQVALLASPGQLRLRVVASGTTLWAGRQRDGSQVNSGQSIRRV